MRRAQDRSHVCQEWHELLTLTPLTDKPALKWCCLRSETFFSHLRSCSQLHKLVIVLAASWTDSCEFQTLAVVNTHTEYHVPKQTGGEIIRCVCYHVFARVPLRLFYSGWVGGRLCCIGKTMQGMQDQLLCFIQHSGPYLPLPPLTSAHTALFLHTVSARFICLQLWPSLSLSLCWRIPPLAWLWPYKGMCATRQQFVTGSGGSLCAWGPAATEPSGVRDVMTSRQSALNMQPLVLNAFLFHVKFISATPHFSHQAIPLSSPIFPHWAHPSWDFFSFSLLKSAYYSFISNGFTGTAATSAGYIWPVKGYLRFRYSLWNFDITTSASFCCTTWSRWNCESFLTMSPFQRNTPFAHLFVWTCYYTTC